jgi:phenylacetate-CoA ligase
MFTIRGENVYPSEIDAALNQVPGYGGEHRIIISRAGNMDELLLRVEATPETEKKGADAVKAFKDQVAKRIHTMLGLRAGVEIVPCNSIARTDFKARRVVDDREVFRELNQKLAEERNQS